MQAMFWSRSRAFFVSLATIRIICKLAITRDVKFVMSAALPFVNNISHIVKTCIRRNVRLYPSTMQKTALTTSAMWLFGVIKNVMSSTVPEKYGSQSWAISFLCVQTDETGRRSDETPCWFDRYITWSQLCFVPPHLQMDWGIQNWKSQLWRLSPFGSSCFSQERVNCACSEERYWRRSTYNSVFVNYVKDVTFQLTRLKELCAMILTRDKSRQDGYPIS